MRWCAASVQLPGRRVRLQAVLNGRTRSLSVSRAAGKVRDTRDGILRLRHVRPVVRAGGIRGGECGLRLQTVVNGRTRSLVVRRAAGEEDHRSGTARKAPGASGTLHPSNCPGGEHGLRFRPSLVDGRGALSCVAQPGKRIIAVEPPGTRRARVVRCIRPIARAANAVCGFRPSLVDGGGAFAVSRAAGKVRDTRDGVLRLRHIRPVARAGGIHGGERGLRLQTVIGGRTRSLYRASRGRESGTAFYTSGTSVQSPVQAESAAAASTACSFRPSSMDGRGAFPCATQSRKE